MVAHWNPLAIAVVVNIWLLPGRWDSVLFGQEPEIPSAAATSRMPTNPPIKHLGAGQVEIGKVRLDARERTLRFPAVLNMTAGIVEYLLVASFGKTHESVLRTEVDPYQIHLGMLLLGAQGAGTKAWPESPDEPLPGNPVLIEVAWTEDSRAHRKRAETLIFNRALASPLEPGSWTYNGSRTIEGSFVAQLDGSIVSLITDPNALINNPRPGRENDELWLVNSNGLPELETPLTVIVTLVGTNVSHGTTPIRPPPIAPPPTAPGETPRPSQRP